ncbi:MAG: electron transfer flavoprotein subunit beta/FixA family protein [Spirochaetes bacterium]|nr:electron transfer flavoprotein subunit beta/FixA family protein [Spirochaetota bacterium]
MPLKIAVCVKSVPDPEHYEKISIDPVTKSLVRADIPSVINNADKHSLELAFSIKETTGGEITAFTMGPSDAKEQLYEALAMGADKAVLLSDVKFSKADTLATSYTLSVLLKSLDNFDLVLAGNESDDGGTSHVPSQLGEWLGFPHIMDVVALNIEGEKHLIAHKEVEGGTSIYSLLLPCLVAVKKKINTVRYTTVGGLFEAKSKPLIVLNGDMLNFNEECIGLKGSPTQPGEFKAIDRSRKAEAIEGSDDTIASVILSKIKNALT